MKNDIGGEIRQVSWDQLIMMVDENLRTRIAKIADRADVNGVVMFENMQMDSSLCGQRHFMIYGPGCTYKDVPTGHLGDVPSRFAWPVAYWSRI